MRHLDLFSGIGGFALAARWVWGQSHHIAAFVERDEWCRRVLAHHWPTASQYDDITTFDARPFRGLVDLVTAGYPCQPYSTAGQRKGEADDRALWRHFVRVVAECRPHFVVGENVAGHISMGLDEVISALEALRYEVWPLVIPAAGVDAPHRRDRVWLLAADTQCREGIERSHAEEVGRRTHEAEQAGTGSRRSAASYPARIRRHGLTAHRPGESEGQAGGRDRAPAATDPKDGRRERLDVPKQAERRPFAHTSGQDAPRTDSDTDGERRAERHATPIAGAADDGREAIHDPRDARIPVWAGGRWAAPSPLTCVRGVDDGVPRRVDRRAARLMRKRIHGLGNAIVPEVAHEILLALREVTA